MIHRQTPTGLAGVAPKTPVGVVVTVGIKGKSGAPTMKDRFWLMSPHASSRDFKAGEKSYTSLARDPHPAFAAWNEAAKASEEGATGRRGPGRVGTLRGMIVHADLAHAAMWNRSAQKLPEPHPNPPSQRPACEGNGITARRYVELLKSGEERFADIACPNGECPFAIRRLCKPAAHLIFMLRWDASDPFQAHFPSLLAMYSTRSWNTLRSLMGMFELVLGTRAVAPWEPEESWQPGLAAELGIANPSLFGLPFVMTVSEKTNSEKKSRFPVVAFSPDGDLAAWLVHQREQRHLAGGGERLAIAAPISMLDSEVDDGLRHESLAYIDPAANGLLRDKIVDAIEGEVVAGLVQVADDLQPPADWSPGRRTLDEADVAKLREALGGVSEAKLARALDPTPGNLPGVRGPHGAEDLEEIQGSDGETPADLYERAVHALEALRPPAPPAGRKRAEAATLFDEEDR